MSLLLLAGTARAAETQPDRQTVVRALLARSRLLRDVQVEVPVSLYRTYLRERAAGPVEAPAPVAAIVETGLYRLQVDADGRISLAATVAVCALRADGGRNLPVLSSALAWENVRVDGKEANLPARKRWLRFTPEGAGRFVLSATARPARGRRDGGKIAFAIPRSVRTILAFDSPARWHVTAGGAMGMVRGAAGDAHGRLAFAPRDRMEVTYTRPVVVPPRPPRFELRGDIAWHVGVGWQQVTARLHVGILGGAADRLDVTLPASARRVSVTGPDVREARIAAGRAAVFLRGPVAGRTRLRVSFEAPHGEGHVQRLPSIELADGHWAGGVLAVTKASGARELVSHAATGLREVHPLDLPASSRGMLAGQCVLAYEITSRGFTAAVDVLDLGEFALRESIADLARYQLLFRDDGSVLCRADYEVRNRRRQFLRLRLPRGARILLARVNDKPRPATPIAGSEGAYLLPLVRSKASMKGLVSFPVEVLVLFRGRGLARSGQASLPLPQIDLPIAYGWCELHLPEGMAVRRWSGPLKRVARYSSEMAVASMSYGSGELAEGYKIEERPTVAPAVGPARPEGRTRPLLPPPAQRPARPPAQTQPTFRPAPSVPARRHGDLSDLSSGVLLPRNYYRAGRDAYDRGEYANAARLLRKAAELAPRSAEAANAARLLSNIEMVQGTLATKSRQAKAVQQQVQTEISAANVELGERQQQAVEKGLAAVREGRLAEAQTQLTAAELLGRQLVQQGADKRAQTAIMRDAQEELVKLRRREQDRAKQLEKRFETLRQAGSYEGAIQVGKALQRLKAGDQKVQRELERLAVKTVQDRLQSREGDLALPARPSDWAVAGAFEPAPQLGARAGAARQVRVLRLRHCRADEIAAIVPQALRAGEGAGPGAGVSIAADPRANTLIVSASKEQLDEIQRLVRQLDTPSSAGGGRASLRGAEDAQRRASGRRVYDVRDLLVAAPSFRGPRIDLRSGGPRAGTERGGGIFEDADTTAGDAQAARQRLTKDFLQLVQRAVVPEDLRKTPAGEDDGSIRIANGQLVVTGPGARQRAVRGLLERLREVRGPQVEVAGNIARQRAEGLTDTGGEGDDVVDSFASLSGTVPLPAAAATEQQRRRAEVANRPDFQEFVRRNYAWRAETPARSTFRMTYGFGFLQAGRTRPGDLSQELSGKLLGNLGQKIVVNSRNVDLQATAANALGVRFAAGANGLKYAFVDEAQLRTLREVEAKRPRQAHRVEPGSRRQEAIVGTHALLANGMVANVAFAGERGNTLDINGNAIALPHEGYVLIDNGGFLTAVRSGQMQHWTEQARAVEFAEVPQDIDVPRVGRLVKLEKSLIRPSDDLVIRADYTWEGARR